MMDGDAAAAGGVARAQVADVVTRTGVAFLLTGALAGVTAGVGGVCKKCHMQYHAIRSLFIAQHTTILPLATGLYFCFNTFDKHSF